eukprot:CAMPEP_0180014068 /NCGR_PEP_ID=MMETSP0984-20121128/17933_1 /TAXON_ID=483367 /ORGANISM="non described non described, Strain CCMP 2436" /LENGTH=163 /DNA_ID=CAMNT_0021936625 /DNA_START=208 /DNA_END=694 /DNA_ORIENTATION=+
MTTRAPPRSRHARKKAASSEVRPEVGSTSSGAGTAVLASPAGAAKAAAVARAPFELVEHMCVEVVADVRTRGQRALRAHIHEARLRERAVRRVLQKGAHPAEAAVHHLRIGPLHDEQVGPARAPPQQLVGGAPPSGPRARLNPPEYSSPSETASVSPLATNAR